MHTVQTIDGALFVCEIEQDSFFTPKEQEIWDSKLQHCHKIPCDNNPKWADMVNCEVSDGTDYIGGFDGDNYVVRLNKYDRPAPVYLEWVLLFRGY